MRVRFAADDNNYNNSDNFQRKCGFNTCCLNVAPRDISSAFNRRAQFRNGCLRTAFLMTAPQHRRSPASSGHVVLWDHDPHHWRRMQVAFPAVLQPNTFGRMRLKCDGTRAETRFRLSAKRTSPFKSARASVQSTTASRSVRISGTNAGYTMFRGSVKSTGYPLHSPVSPPLPIPCVTVCHHISNGLYICWSSKTTIRPQLRAVWSLPS